MQNSGLDACQSTALLGERFLVLRALMSCVRHETSDAARSYPEARLAMSRRCHSRKHSSCLQTLIFLPHAFMTCLHFAGRQEILQSHIKKQGLPLGDDVTVGSIAGSTTGFTGADLANLVNEAALLAGRSDKGKSFSGQGLLFKNLTGRWLDL